VTAAAPQHVLAFWRAAGPDKWFSKDEAFDREITTRFLATHAAAAAGRLADWEATPENALALLILLDQFPRNMFRDRADAFATDPLARAVADRAVTRGFHLRVLEDERLFFVLPFEHSERLADRERSIALSREINGGAPDKWTEIHADIIRRFGRFPHRNAVLGRATTSAEQAFLDAGGFAG
jgi:uncharacterized protein (DUF924 family)